jgi:beta-fructofuranosidase
MHDLSEAGTASAPTSRPALHLTAREGWINDPVGLTYHQGLYHQFFQHIPRQTVWSPECRWGHAVSEDLLTWTERDIVLTPGDGDGGCWSGSLVVDDDGQATIFYTTVQLDDLNIGRIRTAKPDDQSWSTWRKGAVIAAVAPTVDTSIFRDPHVSRDAGGWRMLVGAGRTDGTATALAYSSGDLIDWSFDGEFASRPSAERDPVWTGAAWECPQLIPFRGKYALLFSVWEPWIAHYEAYAIGQMIDGHFEIDRWGRLSYGNSYYAGAAFTDADGRAGLIYWLRGIDDSEGRWVGAHSLPHVLRLDENDILIPEPHPNIAQRRGQPRSIGPDSNLASTVLPPVAEAEWEIVPDQPASLNVLSADGASVLRIFADDVGLQIEIENKTWRMPSAAHIRLIFDGPILELFGSTGVFSAPIPGGGAQTISVAGSGCSIYRL